MDRVLLYELTCPSCNHAERLSFVRIDAVADCPVCAYRYAVSKDSLRHYHLEDGELRPSTNDTNHTVRSGSGRKLGRLFNKLTGTKVAWGAAAASPLVILIGFFVANFNTTSEPSSLALPSPSSPSSIASPASLDSQIISSSHEVQSDSPVDILPDAGEVDASQRMAGSPALPISQ